MNKSMSEAQKQGMRSESLRDAPHPVLDAYYQDAGQRRAFLDDVFSANAADYDRIEKLIGFGSGPWYRRQALLRAGLQPGMSVIDVGVGTGLVAREAVRIVGDPARVTGVDPNAVKCVRHDSNFK